MRMLQIVTITLLVFITAIAAVNALDRELRPEANEIIAYVETLPPSGETGSNNAYFAVLGFESPESEDIVAEGRKIHEEYYRTLLEGSGNPVKVAANGKPFTFAKPSDIPQCPPDKPGCLAFYAQNNENLTKLFKENRLLLDRYDQLRSYPEYKDLMRLEPWSSHADLSSAIYSGHALYTAEAANLFHKGQQQQAISMVIDDIGLWRKLSAGTADITGKTFSLLALMRDYSLLTEMLDTVPGITEISAMQEVLSPLSGEEKSLDLIFDGYLQQLYWSLSHHRWPFTQKKMSMVESYLCKENATLNQAFDIFDSLKRTAKVTPERLAQEHSLLDEKIQKASRNRIDMVYNPIGKKILAKAFDSTVSSSWNNNVQMLSDKIDALGNKAGQKGGHGPG